MDNPLFGGCWGRVPERRSYQRPHYYYPNPCAATSYATPVKSESAPKVKPKNVVTIPVNFVNSETTKPKKVPAMDENAAAVKIQAAFRGFCVRKPRPLNKLRVIMKTKAEVAEIRRRVNDEHVVELIRRDEKERLKITEGIMSLLLRLDEIQGVIPFVRESRKAVIRELVNLQETVDNILAAKSRQDAAIEVSVTSEAAVEECPTVEENGTAGCLEENPNEEFKSKELPGGAVEVSVSNEKAESLPSQMQDLQIEGAPEEDNNNNVGVENFEQGSSEAGQIVSGTEEYTMVDVVDKDSGNLKRNREESPVLEADASPTIPCTEEGVMGLNSRDDENPSKSLDLEVDASPSIPCTDEGVIGNSRDDENSSESLDSLKVQTIQSDEKLETADFMDCEEAGDKLPEKVKPIEDISMVREENEILKRTVSDLLKKSEKQSEIIHDLSLRISQLEEQVSQCNKKKKVGDGKKKSGTSTEDRSAQANNRRRKSDRHSSNCFMEDWF
ncbi:BAG family molecular chaperone regulator 6 [Cryptomeria japonica]|uniref:BAG family molecular chaperone regulator 6 n=1 Tax=Cryptomeria japonica TaxID=3369 RepID=UPI0027DA977B|nr:BAG family molecular chaperone regulator 6 [Cryptomeria japonica]